MTTYVARLFVAPAAGASEQQLRPIAAEGLQEVYFKGRGRRRARGLEVELSGIDYVELDFWCGRGGVEVLPGGGWERFGSVGVCARDRFGD